MTESFFENYASISGVWDEMIEDNQVRPPFQKMMEMLQQLDVAALNQKDKLAGNCL